MNHLFSSLLLFVVATLGIIASVDGFTTPSSQLLGGISGGKLGFSFVDPFCEYYDKRSIDSLAPTRSTAIYIYIYNSVLYYCCCALSLTTNINTGSNFVISQRPRRHEQRLPAVVVAVVRRRSSSLRMGNQAKFGIFSPAVYAAKIALGQDKLNKLRGKAISLHSQYIGDFCTWSGAYHLRTRLVKKAKTNGDTLGFLV